MKGQDIAVPSVFVVGQDKKIHYEKVGESISDRASPDTILAAIDALPK